MLLFSFHLLVLETCYSYLDCYGYIYPLFLTTICAPCQGIMQCYASSSPGVHTQAVKEEVLREKRHPKEVDQRKSWHQQSLTYLFRIRMCHYICVRQ